MENVEAEVESATAGVLMCMACSHELEAHEVFGREGQRDLLFCSVKGCHCELLEGEC